MIDPSARVHPSADLEPNVSVGPRTSIWQRAQVRMQGAAGLDLPVTNRLSDEVLSISVRPNLAPVELEAVIAAVREVATPVEPAVAPAQAAPIAGWVA